MSTEKNLSNLVINKVESQTVYDYMKQNSLINEDELYLIPGSEDNATETESGLMSAEDKVKLNNIAEGAEVNVQSDWNITDTTSDAYIKNKPTALPADGGNADTVNNHTVESDVPADAVFTDTVYTHPMYDTKSNGLYKITVDDTGHVSDASAVTKADITALGVPTQDTTYSEATITSAGLMSATDKSRLDGLVAIGGEANQNAFSNVIVGDKIITADNTTDTFTIIAGDNITLTSDEDNNGVTITAKDTTYGAAGASLGLVKTGGDATIIDGVITIAELDSKVEKVDGKGLSTNDYTTDEKNKLAGIEPDANNYSLPVATSDVLGGVKSGTDITVDSAGNVSVNDDSHNHIVANVDGLQSTLDGKVDKVDGKGLSTNDLTATLKSNYDTAYTHSQQAHAPVDAEKNVVVGVQKNGTDLTVNSNRKVNITVPTKTSDLTNDSNFATITDVDNAKVIVDSALSSTSTNPVQNKIINAKFDSVQASINGKVDIEAGKGLSTNDLTNALKSNYDAAYTHSQQAHAPADAEANVIVGIQKNGTDLTVDSNKKVNITVPTKISDLTNDSNFATTTDIESKVNKETGKGLSSNDYTTDEKNKLAGIESGANKTVVDSALNSTSTNPVQNKVVDAKFITVQADIDSKVPSSRKVNGKALTADITLSASDVGALPASTVIPSIDGLATETYVNNKVAGLVDSAPETLNTLNELAAALGDDPNFATTVANQIGTKVDKVDGKVLSTNDYTTTEKTKLASIAEGAEVNQNAFSSIVVGSTTISADSKTDALTMTAGDNVTISADADSDKITISAVDTVYTHPSYTPKSSGLYKVTVDNTGHVSATTTVTKSDITNLGIPAQDTTYSTGTSSVSGLTKLYSATGANTDGTMTQSAITSALNDKVDVANGQYAVTTGGDGAAYTATVPGIATLTAGVSFIMIPHVVSTSTSPTLDVNGLGAKNIKRRLTSIATSSQSGYTASWLGAGLPFRVVYDGAQWIVEGHDKPAGADLYGAASKATADEDGNNIIETYATKVELESYLPKTTITFQSSSATVPTSLVDGTILFIYEE